MEDENGIGRIVQIIIVVIGILWYLINSFKKNKENERLEQEKLRTAKKRPDINGQKPDQTQEQESDIGRAIKEILGVPDFEDEQNSWKEKKSKKTDVKTKEKLKPKKEPLHILGRTCIDQPNRKKGQIDCLEINSDKLINAIIWSEILAPPIALRDD